VKENDTQAACAAFIAGMTMVSRKQVPPNYDYTGKERVERQRKALNEAGGKRVEAHLDADELAKLDALVATGVAGSRRAALKYLVQRLPEPRKQS
jgi:hypothetical protein